jgi:hypothetical protein
MSSYVVKASMQIYNYLRTSSPTSSDQQLKVSISLPAQACAPAETDIHPACETLQPQLPTCSTAPSSSSSSAFDVLIRPSEDAESKILGEDEAALAEGQK